MATNCLSSLKHGFSQRIVDDWNIVYCMMLYTHIWGADCEGVDTETGEETGVCNSHHCPSK